MIRRRFRRSRGGVDVALPAEEASLLASLPAQLRELLAAPLSGDDPVATRLFPRAYLDPTEERAEEEWRAAVLPELVADRLAALEVVTESLGRGRERRGRVEVHLTADEADAWLRTLNDLRLTLGTRLEVTEDLDVAAVPPDDPRAPQLALYAFLTWVQGDLVETLL